MRWTTGALLIRRVHARRRKVVQCLAQANASLAARALKPVALSRRGVEVGCSVWRASCWLLRTLRGRRSRSSHGYDDQSVRARRVLLILKTFHRTGVQDCSSKLLPSHSRIQWITTLPLPHLRIDHIDCVQRQAQELVLVVPPHILLLELFGLLRRRWWLGDLGNEVGGRSFSDAVDQHTQQRHLQEQEEGEGEAIEHTRAVVEPELLLLRGVSHAGKVRVELRCVSSANLFFVRGFDKE